MIKKKEKKKTARSFGFKGDKKEKSRKARSFGLKIVNKLYFETEFLFTTKFRPYLS